MPVRKSKILICCTSLILLIFLCYGAYPRDLAAVSGGADIPLTVIIDAGHGGEDGGASAANGVKESDLNLQIALRADDLAALTGLRSLLTRQGDISLHDASCTTIAQKKVSDLRNRVKTVNMTENGVLLSIHQNHFPEGKYHGAQVFFSSDSRSASMAEAIQQDLRENLDPHNRRQAKLCRDVYLMEHVACPAILVECGFLSNEAELLNLQDEGYQKRIVLSILRTIAQKGNGVFDSEI